MANQWAIQDQNQFPALTGHSGTAGTAETRRVVVDEYGAIITGSPIPTESNNGSIALSYTSGELSGISKTIGTTTYSRILTYTDGNLVGISAWS